MEKEEFNLVPKEEFKPFPKYKLHLNLNGHKNGNGNGKNQYKIQLRRIRRLFG